MNHLSKQRVVIIEVDHGLANQITSTMRARDIDYIVVESLEAIDTKVLSLEQIVIVADIVDHQLMNILERLQYIQHKGLPIYLLCDNGQKELDHSPLKKYLPIHVIPKHFSANALCNMLIKNQLESFLIDNSFNSLFYLHTGIKQLLYHEFNTPMTAIVGFTELLKSQVASSPTVDANNYIQYIDQSADRLLTTVKKFRNWYSLNFFFNETAKAIYREKIDFVQCLKEMANRLSENFKRSINIKIDASQESIYVISDKYFMSIILVELIDNAFRHSDKPVTISLIVNSDNLLLEIVDESDRISADVLNTHLPFVQYDRKKYEQQGVGVGLSLAMMSARLLNMSIKFFDHERTGIKSVVYLPFNI